MKTNNLVQIAVIFVVFAITVWAENTLTNEDNFKEIFDLQELELSEMRTVNLNFKTFFRKNLSEDEAEEMFYDEDFSNGFSSKELKQLFKSYEWMLKQKTTLAWLIAITKVEGAPSPFTVVGFHPKFGYRGKSVECQKLIGKLTLKSHAKAQKLPQECFERTEAGPSSAFGYGQFVYKTWQDLEKRLKLKNFSRKTQAIGMLELGRQASRKGFIGLVMGNLRLSVLSTTSWAGSSESDLPGYKPEKFLKVLLKELKLLQDKKYYNFWYLELTNNSIR